MCGSNRAEADAVVKEIEAKGGKAMAAVADVTDAPAVNAMAEAALKKFGRIDFLVNNAALRDEKHIDDMTFEDWRLVTGVILDGAFHCVKACLPAIKKSDAGSIINIGGLTGAMGAPDRAHVVTAKAGIAGFSRALAMELAPHKITVNTLVPAMLARPENAERDSGASGLYAAARPRRLADRLRAARALHGRPGRALHDGPDHQRERRDIFLGMIPRWNPVFGSDHAQTLTACRPGSPSSSLFSFCKPCRPRSAGSFRSRGRIHGRVRLGWSWVGYLIAANIVGALFALTVGVGFMRRIGGVRTLQLSLLIGAAAFLLYLVPSIGLALLASACVGLGNGTANPAGSEVLQRFTPPAHRNLVFSDQAGRRAARRRLGRSRHPAADRGDGLAARGGRRRYRLHRSRPADVAVPVPHRSAARQRCGQPWHASG